MAFEVMKFLDVVSPCTGCSLRRGTPGFLAESPYEKLPGAGRTVFDAPLRRYSPGAERVTRAAPIVALFRFSLCDWYGARCDGAAAPQPLRLEHSRASTEGRGRRTVSAAAQVVDAATVRVVRCAERRAGRRARAGVDAAVHRGLRQEETPNTPCQLSGWRRGRQAGETAGRRTRSITTCFSGSSE